MACSGKTKPHNLNDRIEVRNTTRMLELIKTHLTGKEVQQFEEASDLVREYQAKIDEFRKRQQPHKMLMAQIQRQVKGAMEAEAYDKIMAEIRPVLPASTSDDCTALNLKRLRDFASNPQVYAVVLHAASAIDDQHVYVQKGKIEFLRRGHACISEMLGDEGR